MPFLHVAHDAKCFLPRGYSYFHRQLSNNFILPQKMPTSGLYEYKVEGSGCGFNHKRASLRLIHNLS